MAGTGPIFQQKTPALRIAELRLCKSPAEIEQMKYASIVSSIAHEAAIREAVTPTEQKIKIQAIIEGFFVFSGTSGWALSFDCRPWRKCYYSSLQVKTIHHARMEKLF